MTLSLASSRSSPRLKSVRYQSSVLPTAWSSRLDGTAELLHERVLGAGDGGFEFVALALELVGAVAGELQRILGRVGLVEEVGAELAEGGDFAFVEGLLRGDDGVRVLLRVAQCGRDFASLEDVAVDRQGHLRRTDQEGDQYLDRGEVPPVGLRLEGIDDGLDGDLLAQFSLRRTNDSTSSAGAESFDQASASNRPPSGLAAPATCCSL